jgi:transcriptional regulator with XRE-family HTH domain
MSHSYLSLIETGRRPVTKRSTLEALANALRVSPSDLTSKPWERANDQTDAQANLVDIAAALDAYELGEDPEEPTREWPAVAADVRQLVEQIHYQADYTRQAVLAPKLLGELHALYVRDPDHRREILLALVEVYKAVVLPIKYLDGSVALSLLAAKASQMCAEELGSPEWRGIADCTRCLAAGSLNRPQQYRRAVRTAEELSPRLDDTDVVQVYGMSHLWAALAAAAQSDRDTATTHLNEASAVAERLDGEVGMFAHQSFGRANVGIWRVAIGLELGDGASVTKVARDVHVEAIPSQSRRASFYSDVGRALLTETTTREKGLALLLRAEKLAPQKVHNDVFVREAVGGALRFARRDAGGRELRGLAYRVGLAPNG